MSAAPQWRPPATSCRLCDQGHRRERGVHIPSQSAGMIQATPCDLVEAIFDFHGAPGTHDPDARFWIGYVDGNRLKTARGGTRSFKTEQAALAAARKADPGRR